MSYPALYQWKEGIANLSDIFLILLRSFLDLP